MKVSLNGDSVTYYANYGQHVVIYQLAQGETISVESENILAFTQDCDYSVRFIVWVYFPKKVLLLPHLRPEAGMHMLPYCQTATLLY